MCKKIFKISALFCVLVMLCACKGNKGAASNPQNLLSEEQVSNKETTEETTENKKTTEIKETTEKKEETTEETTENATENSGSGKIDVDLVGMSSNMIFGEVNNMMMNPDEYMGKTVRIEGQYSPLYYDGTGKYYHYCVIADALACCSQGIEFIWDNNSHGYPSEYPKQGQNIQITGVFDKYTEEGYIYYYLDIDDIVYVD